MKKLKIFLALLLTINPPISALADTGRYIRLQEGDPAPWLSWCFDQTAISVILAGKEIDPLRCQLKLDTALEKQKAKFDLDYGKLTAELNYEINTRQAAINALSKENLKLEKSIIHNDKYGWITPFILGAAIGATTIALTGFYLYER